MKRRILYFIPIAFLLAGTIVFFLDGQHSRAANVPQAAPNTRIAAPGRVEPVSEEILVSPELSGRLSRVLVDEGAQVRRGDTLALIENAEYRARVASAEAVLQQRRSELERLLNGARPQEVEQAHLSVEAAKTIMENAGAELQRRETLLARGAVSEEEFGRSQREYRVAESGYRDAIEQDKLVAAGARQEERERARAEMQAAEAQLAEARSYLAKTVIRSPLSGVVLTRHAKAGESVSSQAPVFTLADNSVLRVRADVDEVDVAHLAVGQAAFVKADAFGSSTFPGKIVRIGRVLGKKNVLTDQPKEKLDNKVLEVLIELESGHELPIGLRVDTFIETGSQH